MWDYGAVSVSNVPGLNPKSLRNVYDVKTFVFLIAIRQSNGKKRK